MHPPTATSQTTGPSTGTADEGVPHVRVAIVGTGFAGLGIAIRLAQCGVTDFLVLERAGDVGGTWRDNTYPGAACDVPSHLYSFSFAPNPTWTRSFSAQAEIHAYLRDCVDRFGIRPHLRFHTEVLAARWDDAAQHWHLQTTTGELTAQVLLGGMGALSEPSIPDLPGLADFTGTVFHSARWDHDHDLTGERVAVVGTGASAIQFVPQIAGTAAHVDVYQRTPAWVVPRLNRRFGPAERAVYRRFPAFQRLMRAAIYWSRESYVLGFTGAPSLMRLPRAVARRHLRRQVSDPRLREILTPDYTVGCKRVLISNDFYPAVARPDVDVVPHGVAEVRTRSIVDADGVERPADTIIFGTGFHVTDFPFGRRVRGREGRLLSDHGDGSMQAYRGTTVHGFPNLFLLTGPNTGLGHSSMVFMMEAQFAYILAALRHMARTGATSIEVRADAQERYNAALQERLRRTVWNTGGCSSWYLDAKGNNTTLWPDFTFRFRQQTRRLDVAAYQVRTAPLAVPGAEAAQVA
jgi:cation diffusion facilitator CzcD-associated flavoprotein CzcO